MLDAPPTELEELRRELLDRRLDYLVGALTVLPRPDASVDESWAAIPRHRGPQY